MSAALKGEGRVCPCQHLLLIGNAVALTQAKHREDITLLKRKYGSTSNLLLLISPKASVPYRQHQAALQVQLSPSTMHILLGGGFNRNTD